MLSNTVKNRARNRSLECTRWINPRRRDNRAANTISRIRALVTGASDHTILGIVGIGKNASGIVDFPGKGDNISWVASNTRYDGFGDDMFPRPCKVGRMAWQTRRQVGSPKNRKTHLLLSKHTFLNEYNGIILFLFLVQLESTHRFQCIKISWVDGRRDGDQFSRAIETRDPRIRLNGQSSRSKAVDRQVPPEGLEVFLGRCRFNSSKPGVTHTGCAVVTGRGGTVTASESNLIGKECERREIFWEEVCFGFRDTVRFGTVPAAIVAPEMVAPLVPNRDEYRYSPKPMAAMETQMMGRSWPLIFFIGGNGNLHQRHVHGRIINTRG